MSFLNEVEFCLNLLKLQSSSDESSVFSPISLLNSLATICVGADGKTAKEILNVIGKNEDIATIIKYYSAFVKRHKDGNNMIEYITKSEETKTLLQHLKIEFDEKCVLSLIKNTDSNLISQTSCSSHLSLSPPLEPTFTGKQNNESDDEKQKKRRGIRGPPPSKFVIKDDGSPGFQLFFANQLFVDKDIPLIETFNELIQSDFDCQMKAIDFKESRNEIVQVMNESADEALKEKTGRTIKSPDINEKVTSLAVLINATVFKGKWAIPFSFRQTAMFYSKIPRQMDFLTKKLCKIPCNKGVDWESVGIPYMEHKQWIFIVLPNDKDGLQNLINKMDYKMFRECTRKSSSRCVSVTIPAFEISRNYSLAKNLRSLGIINLFDPTNCNLSKMINLLWYQKNYYSLGDIIHEAIIKVDEYGTDASAITKNPRVAGCSPLYFKADSPFLYFIVSANRKKEEDNHYIEEEPTEILLAGIHC